jgi:hypothetical protein
MVGRRCTGSGVVGPARIGLEQTTCAAFGNGPRRLRRRDPILSLLFGFVDPAYEPGMGYDFYLQQRYGLRNELKCVGAPPDVPDYVLRDDDRSSAKYPKYYGDWVYLSSSPFRDLELLARKGTYTLLGNEKVRITSGPASIRRAAPPGPVSTH